MKIINLKIVINSETICTVMFDGFCSTSILPLFNFRYKSSVLLKSCYPHLKNTSEFMDFSRFTPGCSAPHYCSARRFTGAIFCSTFCRWRTFSERVFCRDKYRSGTLTFCSVSLCSATRKWASSTLQTSYFFSFRAGSRFRFSRFRTCFSAGCFASTFSGFRNLVYLPH